MNALGRLWPGWWLRRREEAEGPVSSHEITWREHEVTWQEKTTFLYDRHEGKATFLDGSSITYAFDKQKRTLDGRTLWLGWYEFGVEERENKPGDATRTGLDDSTVIRWHTFLPLRNLRSFTIVSSEPRRYTYWADHARLVSDEEANELIAELEAREDVRDVQSRRYR